MQINEIIIAPVLTEKATLLAGSKVYAFYVHKKANKKQIAHALEQLYGVTVSAVRIVRHHGKTRRIGKSFRTTTLPDQKIAYVKVSEGEISLFPVA